jgi:N-acetyl-gamma-glutamyl-phosphate reductase
MVKQVFIDGEAGTTGLQVRDRLANRKDLNLLSIDPAGRKDPEARRKLLNSADAVVLCLPDAAAREAAAMVENPAVKIIDASTAHRVDPDWVYGLAEMHADQRERLATATRIANPGCYPTGFILLVRPLIDAGVLPEDSRLNMHAISGYSGGGKQLIEVFDNDAEPYAAYGLNLNHKHIPEMQRYTALQHAPIFCPSIADYPQGMIDMVPVHLDLLAAGTKAADLQAILAARYAGEAFVRVLPMNSDEILTRGAFLRPDRLLDTNNLEIIVYANDAQRQALLVACYDNLGKGASGAAVQNLNIALGLDETKGVNLG